MNLHKSADKYIKESRKYHKIALKELKESMKNGKVELAVDGCAKGWLAVTIATDVLFLRKGEKEENLPKGYRGKVYFLRKYGDRELRKIFDRAYGVLHIDGYYNRFIEYDRIFESLDDVKEYIDIIESLET